MRCPSCGTDGLQRKFCPECGAKLAEASSSGGGREATSRVGKSGRPVIGGGGGRSGSSALDVAGTGQGMTPGRTMAGLSNAPRTERGRNIAAAMDDLADEVFSQGYENARQPQLLNQSAEETQSKYSNNAYRRSTSGRLPASWDKGPSNQEGSIFDVSDRNILCMDVDEYNAFRYCVVGGADHGLRVYDLNTKRETKNLYTKKFGHSDWVTGCAFLSDGRIVSGGQDNKLCLWARAGVRCQDLLGHSASISDVKANASNIAVSSSYDRTLKVWDCDRGRELASLAGHKAPVMQFVWANAAVVSGDRQGAIRAWDLETASCTGVLKAENDANRGQCSALGFYSGEAANVVMAGDQSGRLRVWDLRSGPLAVQDCHLHPGGAVTGIKQTPTSIVTCGADKKVNVVDPQSFRVVHSMASHQDFIYAMETLGERIISGDGRGWLVVHDALTGECLYGLGANKAAVRCIFAHPTKLVAAGDDGNVITYDM
ncbi:F-box/WD repeat-containing protein 7 [Diplonema papillatum]|nr:F-box/WD repeat-containing protein 7 [Diplonema papillatum]